jgi:hypothetical protein
VLVVYSLLQLRDRVRQSARLEADRLAFRRRVLQEDETAEWFCTMCVRFLVVRFRSRDFVVGRGGGGD